MRINATFPFAKFFDFMLIVSMIWVCWCQEVEFGIINFISFDSFFKAGTISGYKAGSLVNNIFFMRVKEG